MARRKTERKAAFNGFPNSINNSPIWKGKWKDYFENNHSITLELGCGKADHSIGLAQQFPDRNFIAIDLKTDRLWVGAQKALEIKLPNLAFLRMNIAELTDFFAPREVSEIWITFPDPYPKKRHVKRRLIHSAFLHIYKQVLQPNHLLHLKTDNRELFEFTLEHYKELKTANLIPITILAQTFDLYSSPLVTPQNSIQTDYERRFRAMGKPIHYLQFRLA